MSEMLELADEFESTKTYVVLHYVDGSKGLTKQQQLSIAAALRSSAVSAQPASCDACKKPFAEGDDVVLMGARGNFHQSCFLARAEPQSAPTNGVLDAAKTYIRLLTSISAGDHVDIYNARDAAKRRYETALAAHSQAVIAPQAAIENLTNHQVQCDQDGVMIQVSRQALDEVLSYVALTRPKCGDGQ